MPKKLKTYSQKSKNTKYQYYNYFDKIIKSGKSVSQIKRMNVKQWQKTFGKHGRLKKEGLESKKRIIISQIKNDINQVVSDYIERQNIRDDAYRTFLYNRSYELFRAKKEKIEKVNVLNYESIENEGQYGVVKITDLKDEQEYFIKYKDDKGLNKRLENLKKKYKIKNFVSRLLGVYMYKTEITNQFKKRLSQMNLA